MGHTPTLDFDLNPLVNVDPGFLETYNISGPRYTSYPTAPMWTEDFNHQALQTAIVQTNRPDAPERQLPLSLYVHLPFCEARCLFCSCNVVITQQREQAEKYLEYLFKDIDQTQGRMDDSRPVRQLHWGGGTPTYLTSEQMTRLFHRLSDRFNLAPDAEIALEVDPRVTTVEQLETLRALGFNRISLGVQDFQPETQAAIHRIQSEAETETLVQAARRLGYGGINFDLIYGLPHQTEASFDQTLDTVIALNPDRIALYNFAYVPWMSPHQKQIDEDTLPPGPEKFAIFRRALHRLLAAGYRYIGMDHFAKPEDELTIAQQAGKLHRNFMGYTVNQANENTYFELYGFGVSAISGLKGYYAQNLKKLSTYYGAVTDGHLPTWRGTALTRDDEIRRAVITEILCHGQLNFDQVGREWGIETQDYFLPALKALKPMAEDGLLTWTCDGFALTPLGRIFSRNVAMPFDGYLKKPKPTATEKAPIYSKTL